ncbi:aromatase/cyclase [Streptomyces lydicamycinicus]|uniref:aromatase/cyclase n=1 Tax=Streptomyces lydicamycinicus TaxID=1546107 RepID=UPI003C2FBA3B
MPAPRIHHTVHETAVEAPADRVYALVRDAASWPQRFTPTVHVRREELGPRDERLHLWATANDEVKHWTSHRTLDPVRRRVTFRQEVCSPPVAAMGGEWVIEDRPGGTSTLTLHHDFAAVDDLPGNVEWITSATDRNSTTELQNIKALAEGWREPDELLFSFEDHETVHAPADTVYGFLRDADQWPHRLPHVARMELAEPSDGIQQMTMVTRAGNGSEHTTASVRVCFPAERTIVYKQVTTPPLMTLHTGRWTVADTGDGLRVTSQHTIRLNAAAIPAVVGEGATPAEARTYVREAVGGNSAATLALAKEFAEARHAD